MTGTGTEQFLQDAHGMIGCVGCHQGVEGKSNKTEAHAGLVAYPSEISVNVCAQCHDGIADRVSHSLHTTMGGYHTMFEARTGQTLNSSQTIRDHYEGECNKCHATCGSCHISRPKSAGGGFIQGHSIKKTPDMSLQCTACHGSRIGEEYTGAHQGLRSDVHYVPNAMHCKNCHTGEQIHGDGTEYAHRYENASLTRCRDCHHIGAENGYHATHGSEFACQVCHSQDYKNCNDCHAGSGLQEPSYLQFKIGRNPISELRSGSIAVLRHVPSSEQTYSAWGVESSTYSSLPTFKYASPHNIVRWTSRTDTSGGQSCFNACHNTSNGPDGFFLRLSDLDTLSVAEREANLPYVVPDGPPPWN